ncbi:hypothetical protein BBBOND_0106590 [Babesia bigemina]|uniref:6-Cys domain-containing protein n=1 Tax=Babesia bigemina TaxID=5866 RepID=A0A061D9G3_BABBI|nr:hypothetical protein BBBOND_0106590 [Babesia bigemina]CDR94350.1 hypothetical protein BBBOND_0106590 [Babesia bigemina]|eukprot:XP_012766536.1 hypothetical protein BBBOND_0106590 [Babesia bigemina]
MKHLLALCSTILLSGVIIDAFHCDFYEEHELIRGDSLVVCEVDIGHDNFATIICPRQVNNADYTIHPRSRPDTGNQIETYVSDNWKLRSVPLSDVIVTEVPHSFAWMETTLSCATLYLTLKDYYISAITEHRFTFICGPRDLVMSDALQRHLNSLDGTIQTQEHPNSASAALEDEIKKIVNGLGIVFMYRGHKHLPLQGCGTRPSPLFDPDMEVTVDRVTGTRSCVANPMSKSRIGFLCEGRIEPHDCMISLIDENGGVVTAPRPFPYWSFNYNMPWVVGNYFYKFPLDPFQGECRCVDPRTGQVKAKIEIRSKMDYVCDIASKIFRNRFRPISGPWCSVVLHPGSKLTIKVPMQPVISVYIDEGVSGVPFSQLPSIYEYETAFLPKDLTTLRQLISLRGADIYDEVFYYRALAGDALELDASQISRGEVTLKYHSDKPLALRSGLNSFYYNWTLISNNDNIPDRIRATINVSFAFNHEYTKVGCDRGQRHVFDQQLSRKYCTNKVMSNDIGSIYECALHLWRDEWRAGINCSPDEELLPKNCNSTAYDLSFDRIARLPVYLRSATHHIRGFQVFDFEYRRDIPIKVACICVDQRGYEKSRLVLESYEKRRHNFEVSRGTRFNKIFAFMSPPWRKVGMLLEEPTSTRLVVLHNISKKTVNLRVGTKLVLRCTLGTALQDGANDTITPTVWLPEMHNEFHYIVIRTSQGSTLIRKAHRDSVATTFGGLEVIHQEIERGRAYEQLVMKLNTGAIAISRDPVHTERVPMRFVCGKAPLLSDSSAVSDVASPSASSARSTTNITELAEKYTWNIVKVNVETTDPYMQGCGVTYESDELFKPETPQLYDADGQPQFGCKIDIQAAKEAAFYCPPPYLLDPPNCFYQVSVNGEVKNVSDVSTSLVDVPSRHFVILRFDSELIGPRETLRETPPLECRCVTIKGAILSTIRIENYYSKR